MTTFIMTSLSPCCRSFPVPVWEKCTSGLKDDVGRSDWRTEEERMKNVVATLMTFDVLLS